jgi:hypothetical protein
MALPNPTPPDPTRLSAWKLSDIFYVGASFAELFAGYQFFAVDHPIIAGFLSLGGVFGFWLASYAAAKGD